MWQKIVHWIKSSVHESYKLRTCCVHKLFFVFCIDNSEQFVYTTCSELVVFIFWTCNSMKNLLSYCGLVDARISGSEKKITCNDSRTVFMLSKAKEIWFHSVALLYDCITAPFFVQLCNLDCRAVIGWNMSRGWSFCRTTIRSYECAVERMKMSQAWMNSSK